MSWGSPLVRVAQSFARLCGRELLVIKKPKKGAYERSLPKATYAPWRTDIAFIEAYEKIKDYTLVDQYRCYELWQLVAEAAKVPGALLEVGVWRGGTGALIARRAAALGIADTVYLADTFTGVVKAGEKDSQYRGGEHADTSEAIASDLLKKLELPNAKILKGIFPDDTADRVQESAIRFCHIDVDVYQSAKDILDWVWPRLSLGGIVVFDDYGFATCQGITRLVDEQRGRADRAVVHNLNGHAVVIKR